MTFGYVKVLVCVHFAFFSFVSSQGEEEQEEKQGRQRKRWWQQVTKKSKGQGKWRL